MIKISERDNSDALHMAYTDGKKAIQNRKKQPHISNPYQEGTGVYESFEKGVKEQKEVEGLK